MKAKKLTEERKAALVSIALRCAAEQAEKSLELRQVEALESIASALNRMLGAPWADRQAVFHWYGPYTVEYLAPYFDSTKRLDLKNKKMRAAAQEAIKSLGEGFIKRPDPTGNGGIPEGFMVRGFLMWQQGIPIA